MIIDWQEIWNGRRGELDNAKATRKYERVFRAITDDATDGPAEIFTETGLPGLAATYVDANGTATDLGAILRNIRIDQEDDNPFVWLVRCEYSSEPFDVQQQEQTEDPLARPPIWSLDTERFQRVLETDKLGNPVVNSAGAPFSPLPEVDDSRIVLTMERNEQSPAWQTILQYQDAVNSDEFLGFGPGVWKVNVKAQKQYENNLLYWKVTYTFSGRAAQLLGGAYFSGWDTLTLDRGYYSLDAQNKPRMILDAQGNPPGDPVLLDGTGHVATPTSVISVTVSKAGGTYRLGTPPTVVFSGGGGSGATGVAVMSQPNLNQYGFPTYQVVGVTMTSTGIGYTTPPTVSFSPGGVPRSPVATANIGLNPQFLISRGYNWLPYSALDLPGSIN